MADVGIRRYRPDDRADVYDICLRTADDGGDAHELYARDLTLPGDLFAGPYVDLEPDFAFVLDDGERAAGYVLGTPDTAEFVRKLREVWVPKVGQDHPAPTGERADHVDEMRDFLHHPERLIRPELADYPAHLHIDLLPHVQRAGWGRRLIYTLLDALHEAQVPRVYLGMVRTNTAARAFYDRLGFHPIDVADPGVIDYLGRSTEL